MLWALALGLLLSVSCEKETEPTMPPLTFTGANTFACYINSELFVAQSKTDMQNQCSGGMESWIR